MCHDSIIIITDYLKNITKQHPLTPTPTLPFPFVKKGRAGMGLTTNSLPDNQLLSYQQLIQIIQLNKINTCWNS